jgi:DNA-directed RNA polymerase specialized sigma24 family protein
MLPGSSGGHVFATTQWSVVLSASQGDPASKAQALEKLCQTYWYPLYVYVRRRGSGEHDAQDLVQGFFAQILHNQALERVSQERGKFRSFLLASLNYYLADQRDRASAQRRGGGRPLISIDAQDAEERYRCEPVDADSPDRAYERRWALTLLDKTLTRLEAEFVAADKRRQFDRLSGFLIEGVGDGTLAEAAADLGQNIEATKKAVQRMRHRYHALFLEEVQNTVSTPADLEEELRHLCRMMNPNDQTA